MSDEEPRTMLAVSVSIGAAHLSSHRADEWASDELRVQMMSGGSTLTITTYEAARDLHAALGAWLGRAKP